MRCVERRVGRAKWTWRRDGEASAANKQYAQRQQRPPCRRKTSNFAVVWATPITVRRAPAPTSPRHDAPEALQRPTHGCIKKEKKIAFANDFIKKKKFIQYVSFIVRAVGHNLGTSFIHTVQKRLRFNKQSVDCTFKVSLFILFFDWLCFVVVGALKQH